MTFDHDTRGEEIAAADTALGPVLDYLQDNGYMPQDWPGTGRLGMEADIYELVVSGYGSVVLRFYPGDGYSGDVTSYDGGAMERWSVSFSQFTPDAAILAVLAAGEDELAEMRGGPVTVRQSEPCACCTEYGSAHHGRNPCSVCGHTRPARYDRGES